MADILMVVDAAVITPVNRLPLIDDTDFKTIEAAVAYNAGGMDLRWNFVTSAGVQTSTAVTPTTAGSYDWTHLGDGIYSMEIPASGGASANNDTEGFGWWSGVCTGVLPWAGPIIQFSPANIVNSLVTGSDLLDVNTQEWNDLTTVALPLVPTTAGRTLDVSAGGEAGVDWANVGSPTSAVNLSATTTNLVNTATTTTTATNLTNAPTNGDLTATMKTSVTAAVPTAAAITAAALTTAITEAYRANGAAPTLAQFMSEVLAHLGEASISGTTKTLNQLDHTTPAETFTLDSAADPSSITRAT